MVERGLGRLAALGLICGLLSTCSPKAGTGESTTIGPSGGSYTFQNGITLVVPAGAVGGDTPISIRPLAPAEYDFVLRTRGLSSQDILFAVAGTDGLVFSADVTLVIPTPNLAPGALPIVHTLDLQAQTFTEEHCTAVLHPEAKTVELSISHFSGIVGEIRESLMSDNTECSTPETKCRCGDIRVAQLDSEYSCADKAHSCSVLQSKGSIAFLTCDPSGQRVESYLFDDATDGCVPKVSVTPEQPTIEPGAQTRVTVRVTLGCGPLANQGVSLAVLGDGTLDADNGNSGTTGTLMTTLTAGDVLGTAMVTATVPRPIYYTKHVVVNGITIGNPVFGPDAPVSGSASVKVDCRSAPDGGACLETSHCYYSQVGCGLSCAGQPCDCVGISAVTNAQVGVCAYTCRCLANPNGGACDTKGIWICAGGT